jgi:hypothetical protein
MGSRITIISKWRTLMYQTIVVYMRHYILSGSIDFRVCCKEKQVNHCGECDDFPCEPYTEWVGANPTHKKAFEHLSSLRKTHML